MNLEHIKQIAARHSVQRLELFGSAARGEMANDVDFLVRFKQMPALEHGRAYFALLKELRVELDKPIDLLEDEAIQNPFFLASIAADRRLIYAA